MRRSVSEIPPAGLLEHARGGPDAALHAWYDSLPMGAVLATADNELLFANAAFFHITECTARDLEYMNFEDVLSLFCLGVSGPQPELACAEGQWHSLEKYIRRQDGDNAWVRFHLSRVAGPDGAPLRQLLVDDVTRYKECIDSLLNRKELYQSIVETRPDPVCCFLPDGTITYANSSCQRLLGARPGEDLLGEDFLRRIGPEVRAAFEQALQSISTEQPSAEVEQRIIEIAAPGGQARRQTWVRWIIQGFFYKTGHLKDYQAVGVDISSQKITESRFIHADRLISLGTLVSSVAHEINNPNNFIMLNAPLVMDLWWRLAPALERLAGDRRLALPGGMALEDILVHVPELLQGIVEGSTRIKTIIKELKVFAQKDGDGGFELLSVNDVVQSAVLLMGKTIGQRTERFGVDYGVNLPMILGRRQRLEQIVVNLIQNACNALEDSHQGVHVQTRHDESSDQLCIVVRDEGIGIRPEDLPRVTDPFFSTRRGEGGTGLGLAISLGIAREHGGQLLLESTPGVGTSAAVILPAALR